MHESVKRLARVATGLGLLWVAATAAASDSGDDPVSTIVGAGGLCLGVSGSGDAVGAMLLAQDCTGSVFQKWRFVKEPSGDYLLVNAGSGMCIDVTAGSTSSGTVLQQWGCSGGTYQKWTLADQGAGRFSITSRYNKLVLKGPGTGGRAGVEQWPWSGASSQLWTAPTASVVVASPGPTNNSLVTFRSVRNGSCLGVEGASTASGAKVKAQSCGSTSFQQWKALKNAGGEYQFANVGSGLCMDLPDASIAPGTPIRQWDCSGGSWQKWQLNGTGRGHYYVTSRLSGQALDEDLHDTAGSVIQRAYSGKPSQQWQITAADAQAPSDARRRDLGAEKPAHR